MPAEEPAAPDASDTDGPAEVEDVTAASSLRTAAAEGLELERSERAASGFKGVYQSGGRFTSSYTRDGARPFEPRGPPRLPLTLCSYPFSALSFVFAGETVYLGTFVTPEEAALSLARVRAAHDADGDEDDEGATHDPSGSPPEESSQCEKNPLCTRGESRVFNPLVNTWPWVDLTSCGQVTSTAAAEDAAVFGRRMTTPTTMTVTTTRMARREIWNPPRLSPLRRPRSCSSSSRNGLPRASRASTHRATASQASRRSTVLRTHTPHATSTLSTNSLGHP